ncbi:MAG TPA: hypothetical protein VFN62_14525 [Acidobacteriaceae bacterium]|nr:hypothetical protein [Acidobacteriaceae bacterium]
MTYRRIGKVLAAIAGFAFLVLGSVCVKAQSADSEKINELFNNIRQHAAHAEADADLLESYTRSKMSWESHARRIESMRGHVKDLAADFNEASRMRAEGSQWQQDAINQLQPVLQGMADHLKATIDHLNDNQSKVHMKPWIDYVHANRDYAVRAAELIRDYVDYSEAKSATEKLEQKLQISPSSTTGEE